MKIKRLVYPLLLLVLLIGALSIFSSHASADVAPPEQPPGSNPAPANSGATSVEMTAETVTITVGSVTPLSSPTLEDEAVEARVKAIFTMKNTGSAVENMMVRFPLESPSGMGDGFFNFPEIQGFRVKVDGKQTEWGTLELPNPLGGDNPPLTWSAFQVTFPVNTVVMIEVEYTVQSTGYLPEARFSYVLETGAGWKGPIGSGEIILQLPYEASTENLFLSEYQTKPGYTIDGTQLRWSFTNLEPVGDDNWHATILSPAAWQKILDLRQTATESPQDANAWRNLGELYESIALVKSYYMINEGAPGYVLLAEDAYRKALAINSTDADLHFRLAMVLFAHYLNADSVDGIKPDLSVIVNELNSVLALDPQNGDVEWFHEDIKTWADEPVPPLGSPTFTPEPEAATAIPQATATVMPSASATLTPPAPIQTPQMLPTNEPTPGVKGLFGLGLPGTVFIVGGLCLVSLGAGLVIALVVLLAKRSR